MLEDVDKEVIIAGNDPKHPDWDHKIRITFYKYKDGQHAIAFDKPDCGSDDFIYLYPKQIKAMLKEVRRWLKDNIKKSAPSVKQRSD